MSLQWTLVATFLYTEIAVVIILLLPFISPTRWNTIFQSNAIKTFKSTSHYYFRFSVGILFLLFVDAIRSVRHYTAPMEANHGHHDGPLAEMQYHMKLFRGQRNLYICGFALFLVFVIRRLVVLLAEQANLIAQKEAALKQAKSASEAAQSLMAADDAGSKKKSGDGGADDAAELRGRINEVAAERDEAMSKVESLENQLNALKRQAEGTNREYDRLMVEHEKLQRKLGETGAGDGRKDD